MDFTEVLGVLSLAAAAVLGIFALALYARNEEQGKPFIAPDFIIMVVVSLGVLGAIALRKYLKEF
jgi:hypothetical protein